jgi:hypothetical protein
MSSFAKDATSATTHAELERVVQKAVGAFGLMEFNGVNMGEFMYKEGGSEAPRSLRFRIGSPLVTRRMACTCHDFDRRAPDGVRLPYGEMAGFLTSYRLEEALKVARDLDSKIEALSKAGAPDVLPGGPASARA